MWLKPCLAVGELCANLEIAPNQLTHVDMGLDHQEAQITRMLLPILVLFFPTLLNREVSSMQGCNVASYTSWEHTQTFDGSEQGFVPRTGGTSRAVPQTRMC